MAEITVDTKEIDRLAKDITAAKNALLGRLAERGYQLLRKEVPFQTGNLKQGVASPEVDYPNMTATLTVSARSAARPGGSAQVFDKEGKDTGRKVSLRPSPAYNYAEVIALGNKDATLRPKNAKAFLIPVPTAPSGEGYLMMGGQAFVVRTSRKGMPANPFDKRAAQQLEKEAPGIGEAVLRQFV